MVEPGRVMVYGTDRDVSICQELNIRIIRIQKRQTKILA